MSAACPIQIRQGIQRLGRGQIQRPAVGILPRFAVICALFFLAANGSLAQQEQPKTVLPEFRLLDLGITTNWEANKAGFITRVTVTEVLRRSAAWAPGLRSGDTLLAINHRQVVGMRRDDYLAALEVPLTPANPQIYTFSMSRGFAIVTTSTFDLLVELKAKVGLVPSQPRGAVPQARTTPTFP
jgi:hypothetical protein